MPQPPLHVLHLMEATAGGARKHLRLLALAQRQAGVEVDLVLSPLNADPDFPADVQLLRAAGCHVVLVPMRKSLGVWDYAAYQQVRAILRERRPAVLHTHCGKAGLLGRLAAHAEDHTIRLIHTPHSFFFLAFNGWHQNLGALLERRLGRWTDQLLCVSADERAIAAQYRVIDPDRLVLTPNGLPDDFAAGLLSRAAARDQLGLSDKQFAIGVLARLDERKGHARLLAALAQLPPHARGGLRVFFIGRGPQRAELGEYTRDLGLERHINFYGYLAQAERLLPGLDLSLLLSSYEGLAYQLLESLAAGVAVVATDVPGNRLPEPGNPVTYVPLEDPAALATVLTELRNDPGQRQALAQRGPDFIRAHYRLDTQVAQTLAAYRGLVA